MIKLTIDNIQVQVEEDTTILLAAEKIGIRIPSMCFLKSLSPSTSCMICVVELDGYEVLIPSCAMNVKEGMIVWTNNERVRIARKTALELLLSEHAGDCIAPCQKACPLNIDIPCLIRHIQKKEIDKALDIIFENGKYNCFQCSTPCQKACRRGRIDSCLEIRNLIQFVTKDKPYEFKEKSIEKKIKFNSVLKNITDEEMKVFLNNSSLMDVNSNNSGCRDFNNSEYRGERRSPNNLNNEFSAKTENKINGYNSDEAQKESKRCLNCDCLKKDECKLRDNAEIFGANQSVFSGKRIEFSRYIFKNYTFEPGKCIKCGICVGISEKNNIRYGFTFLKRGFDIRVGIPFDYYEDIALNEIIGLISKSCPTGAIIFTNGGNSEKK